MNRAPLLDNEGLRLASVRSYDVVSSLAPSEFESIARLVAAVCETPIALVTILDETQNVFVCRVGFDRTFVARDDSFCAHAAARPTELLIVPDARADERFRENPLVVGSPFVRFYAGIPLVSPDGFALGALCVLDTVPRHLDARARTVLELAGRSVMALLAERRTSLELRRTRADGRMRDARVALLETVARNASEGVVVLEDAIADDGVPIVTFANAAVAALTGLAPVLQHPLDAALWAAIGDRDGTAGVLATLRARDSYATEALVRHADGAARLLQVNFSPVVDAEGSLPQRWIALLSDITDRTRADAVQLRAESILARNGELSAELERRRDVEERLQIAAAHDSLTGLRNRAYFIERLRARLSFARDRPNDPSFAVMFLDIDRFKAINDTLGHMFGDDLLVTLARRIAGCVRAQDVVARLGGDEFTVLIESVVDREQVAQLADRIARAVAAPCRLGSNDVAVSASIGIVYDDGVYAAAEDVLRDADIAMFHAKANGRDRYECFRDELRERVVGEARLESALARALDGGEFHLAYQPIVALAAGAAPVGFEALLRWNSRYQIEIGTAAIVAAAQEHGLIVGIGEWAIVEAARALKTWHDVLPAGVPRPYVSVNVSSRQLLDDGFFAVVERALRQAPIAPCDLAIELTEHTAILDIARVTAALAALRARGVRTVLDDFGTASAPLGSVRSLPLESVKIDRRFVGGPGRELADPPIVESIVSLAHRLGITAVAKGVETPEQARALLALGCDFAQGSLFGLPVDAGGALRLVRDLASRPPTE